MLGDYANVVSQLIEIFAKVSESDELAIYRDLVTADRDVIRVRATDDDDNGSVAISDGIDLMVGARDMILAAACSLEEPRRLYRAGANQEASQNLKQLRLGQTEQGSYVVTMLTPVIPPPMQHGLASDIESNDDPFERRMTKRLVDALIAARTATERTNRGEPTAFSRGSE